MAGNHYTADHPRPPIPRRKMGPSDLLGCTADGQLVTLTEWQAGAVEALLQGDPIREVFFGLGRGAGKTTVLATVERRLENERAGACGDPECHVLHSDPANPIHPPWYVRP